MINIVLNRDYGPVKQNFNHIFKDGYNVLVGSNNSGKSAIIQYVFQNLVREVTEYGAGKVCLILPERIFVDSTYETSGRKLEEHNDQLAMILVSSPLSYNTYASPPRSELAKLLLTHDDLIKQNNKLNEFLQKLELPELIIGPGQNITFEYISVGFQGSGLRSLLPIISALTDPKIKVLLIDEPELSLEPKVQKLLRDLLYEVSKEKLIVVTTHSHLFLNRKDASFNKKVWKEDGTTRITELNNDSELYDLTFSLLGNNLSDLFFPENFIIVEGSSDEIIINKILELKEIDKTKVKVVSASGIEKVSNIMNAITDTLTPLVINDSPYKKRVVVLIDKRNTQNKDEVGKIEKELTDRFFELDVPSLEEYIPEELYIKAGRNKKSDLNEREKVKNEYLKLSKLKKEISNSISSILEESDIEKISIINDAVERAVKREIS